MVKSFVGKAPEDTCRFCQEATETARHLLCECEAVYRKRLQHLGFWFLKPEQVTDVAPRKMTETIHKYGYPVETHELTTEDGYILTMFRIPHGKSGSGVNRKPILLMHGLFGRAENFIIAGIYNASLAYLLADNEFDVWLGNTRGNSHCRRHKTLDPKLKEFWDFSWHEIGIYDVPAFTDYIIAKTKKNKIYYVGHSQGGTSFYILNSMKPEYQQKFILASLLAPAGYFNNFKNPFILPLSKNLKMLMGLKDTMFEFPPRTISFFTLITSVCEGTAFRDMCRRVYHVLMGEDSGEVPKIIIPFVWKYLSSASTRQLIHYAQAIESGHFRPWDYGKERNMQLYGSPKPADYPINKITVPIAIYYGLGDTLVYPKDIDQICKDLPNCVRKFLVKNPKYTHFDFLVSSNVNKLQNEPLLEFAKKYDDRS